MNRSHQPGMLGVGSIAIDASQAGMIAASYDARGLRTLDALLVACGAVIPVAVIACLPGHSLSALWATVFLVLIPWLHRRTHRAVSAFAGNVAQVAAIR